MNSMTFCRERETFSKACAKLVPTTWLGRLLTWKHCWKNTLACTAKNFILCRSLYCIYSLVNCMYSSFLFLSDRHKGFLKDCPNGNLNQEVCMIVVFCNNVLINLVAAFSAKAVNCKKNMLFWIKIKFLCHLLLSFLAEIAITRFIIFKLFKKWLGNKGTWLILHEGNGTKRKFWREHGDLPVPFPLGWETHIGVNAIKI